MDKSFFATAFTASIIFASAGSSAFAAANVAAETFPQDNLDELCALMIEEAEQSSASLDVRFSKNIDEAQKPSIRKIIENAETIWESLSRKAQNILFKHNDIIYTVQRVQQKDQLFYSVKTLQSRGGVPQNAIRIKHDAFSGGLSRVQYFKERDIKNIISEFPVVSLGITYAAALNNVESSQIFFAVYHDGQVQNRQTGKNQSRDDEQAKKNNLREITDIAYPRAYQITKSRREKLLSRHGIDLQTLDEAFAEWDGKTYKDLYLRANGEAFAGKANFLEREETDKKFRWFLFDKDGKTVRIVVSIDPSRSLPEVITAYYPRAAALENIFEYTRTHSPE